MSITQILIYNLTVMSVFALVCCIFFYIYIHWYNKITQRKLKNDKHNNRSQIDCQ